MHNCKACATDPTTHSFRLVGRSDYRDIYYTSPAKATGREPDAIKIVNFKHHLDQVKEHKWVWIFDCSDMQIKHYSSLEFVGKLARILSEEHVHSLDKIFVVNPNLWMRGLLAFMKTVSASQLLKKTHVIEGSNFDMLIAMEKHGISRPNIDLW